jgi:hypothetical protein
MIARATSSTILALVAMIAIGCSNDDGPIDPTTAGKITGTVTSSAGQVVAGAAVSTIPATQSKLTGADGTFIISDVAPGTYVVSVVKEGLDPAATSVTVGAGKTVTADLVMGSGPANGLPNEPSNPGPSDGAVAQPTELTLRWTASDPDNDTLRFDVLLGTSNPPTTVLTSNQFPRVHYIAELDSNTTYYWQVISRDHRGGVTAGPVWRFRTEKANENKAPYPPSNPAPADGAVHRSAQVTLSWSAQDPELDALKYDVYFGTTEFPGLVAEDVTATSLSRANLAPNARYYWRVVVRDNHGGESQGPLWSFTTGDVSEQPGATLVAYYKLDGNAQDASGNSNHGSYNGVSTMTSRHGRTGEASFFDGSNYVTIPHRQSLVFANSDFTVSVWVRMTESLSDYTGILSKCTPYAPERGYQLVVRNGSTFGMQIGSTVPSGRAYFDVVAVNPLSFGAWHHLAMVVDRDTRMVRLFVDGELAAESVENHLAYSIEETEALYIGRERQNVYRFRGGIDDVKIFAGALTGAQIRTLAGE